MMTGTKLDIEKFDGNNDFRLWQIRMKALLEQQGLAAALEELLVTIIVAYDNVIQKKAYNILILCLAGGDLAAIDTAISDEDQALLLLTSIPSSYDNFVETFLYGQDTLKLEYLLVTLNSRELQKMTEAKNEDQVSDSRADGYNNADVMMVMSVEQLLDWIMDLGGTYHMTYMRDYLVDFEEYDGGNVLMGDGNECRIRGTRGFYRDDVVRKDQGYKGFTDGTIRNKKGYLRIYPGWSGKDTTMSTYLVNRSPLPAIGFKTPIDMLGFFGWLASIKQGMLEPVKVKCIFLGYREGTGSVQVLQGVEFEVESQEDHVFEVEPLRNVGQGAGIEKITGLKEEMDARSDVYVLSNGCKKSSNERNDYYWEYAPVKRFILSMEIVRDQSSSTLRVSQSRVYNGKSVQTLLEGHSILSLEVSLSGDCDVKKRNKGSYVYAVGSQEYQVVCTIPDIASTDVGMLDGVQVDDTRMCKKLGSYDAARDGFVVN
ncbi:hypothetical protein Tco_1363124 [Tanacetum coccineum]